MECTSELLYNAIIGHRIYPINVALPINRIRIDPVQRIHRLPIVPIVAGGNLNESIAFVEAGV